MSDKQLAERVSKGAKLLDEKKPDWFRVVKITTLHMGGLCDCVLGQVYGYYYDGILQLDLALQERIDLGFYSPPNSHKLTPYWKQEIRKRRKRPAPATRRAKKKAMEQTV